MENTIPVTKRELFLIDASGFHLKVARVGLSPRIHPPKADKTTSDEIRKVHTHSTYEMFFVPEGGLKLITENDIFDYEKSVIIVPPKTKHISIPVSGDCYCILFSFTCKEEELFFKGTSDNAITQIPLDEDTLFYIQKVADITEKKGDDNDVYHLLSLLFSNLFKKFSNQPKSINLKIKKPTNHMGNIEEFINKNIRNKITLKTLSENMFLSEKQISRIIQKEYGMSFTELIKEKRLAIACALLTNTDMKVSEISVQTFFENESYFYTVFKSKYGITPLKYRRQYKKKDDKKIQHH